MKLVVNHSQSVLKAGHKSVVRKEHFAQFEEKLRIPHSFDLFEGVVLSVMDESVFIEEQRISQINVDRFHQQDHQDEETDGLNDIHAGGVIDPGDCTGQGHQNQKQNVHFFGLADLFEFYALAGLLLNDAVGRFDCFIPLSDILVGVHKADRRHRYREQKVHNFSFVRSIVWTSLPPFDLM